MKQLAKVLIGLFVIICILCGCDNRRKSQYYIESQPSFFALRNENLLTNDWLRKSENLEMLHRTLNSFGYWNFLEFYSDWFDNNTIVERDIYIKKNPLQLIDSLILTYNDKTIDIKYYNEFWARRRAEKNDSIVYEIVSSIKEARSKIKQNRITHRKFRICVNDTLYDLIKIEMQQKRLNDSLALQHFKTLCDYGFHQSAYNLLYERYEYANVKWDNKNLSETLIKQKEYTDSWFRDNTK
ncbi:hypothetical protein [Dysgonomonas massiliensis]|uniref:hypothetical protein n=1 Tax=Dysgonomonas massiliensis TaxID=2040292 RepID=UPI000C784362|nr:hypothetical protein [Dysgonomonas massiliensis]